MSGTKISAAADAGTLLTTDVLPVARSGSTTAYHATMAEVASYANGAYTPNYAVSAPLMDGTAAPGTAAFVSRGDHVHPSDISRAPLASPTFTGVPAAPTPTTGTNTTQLATTAFVQSQMVASGAGVSTWNTRAGAVVLQQADIVAVGALHDVGRNLLHNPLFNVAQRGAGPWTTAGSWLADRWYLNLSLDTASVSIIALGDAGRAAIGDEAALVALQNLFTGNSGAGAQSYIDQHIEKVQRLSGKTVTVSFWAVGSAGLKLGLNLFQFFGSGGSPSAVVFALATGAAVSLSTTWARYSVTIPLPSAAGKTLGTNGDDYTGVRLFYSSGATNNAQAGNIGIQSGSVILWGVQLEIGSVATPLEKPDPRYDLSNCQRFYQTVVCGGRATWSGVVSVSTPSTWPVMRATPTAMLVTAGANANAASIALNPGAANGGTFGFASAASGDAYALSYIYGLSADL